MALTFPLSYAAFFETLPVARATFRLTDSAAATETAGGEFVEVSTGVRLWEMGVTLPRATAADMTQAAALIELLRRPGASFLGGPPQYVGPRADPAGAVLGAATPTLTSVNANMRDIALGGLPIGYVLSPGDFLSFDYGGRQALHRCIGAAVANGSGQIAAIEVDPAIRPGWSASAPVRLINPRAKFKILPGQLTGAVWGPGPADPFAFVARQTLS